LTSGGASPARLSCSGSGSGSGSPPPGNARRYYHLLRQQQEEEAAAGLEQQCELPMPSLARPAAVLLHFTLKKREKGEEGGRSAEEGEEERRMKDSRGRALE